MKKEGRRKWIIIGIVLLVLLLAIAGAIVATVYLTGERPYDLAWNTMPQDGVLTLNTLEDGYLELSWPEGEKAQFYYIQVLRGEEEIYSILAETDRSCVLPPLGDREYTIRVQSGRRYDMLGRKDLVRFGDEALSVTGVFTPPTAGSVTWEANPTRKILDVFVSVAENETCQLEVIPEGEEPPAARELTAGQTTYTYGAGGELPLLSYGKEYRIRSAVCRTTRNLIFQGPMIDGPTLDREDLLGTKLAVACQDLGNNRYLLTWNETKGERYQVLMRMEGEEDWRTVAEIPRGEERKYITGYLPQNTNYEFEVLALGGKTLPDSEYAAEPGYAAALTGYSPVGSTIWPVQDLKVYDTPGRHQVIGTAPQATAYCVLDREEGMFQIRFGDGYGYIDCNYCMINLAEFLGDLCQYDIVNSYQSLYMVHEYAIPEVTDTVVAGYEDIQLADGSFLVPLLYPTAQKLEQAAQLAKREGYIIRIYDAYRPRMATVSIFDLTELSYFEPLPEQTNTGETVEVAPGPPTRS